ncbi:MAG TPA: hypothetical protein VK826_16570 [Bacteroidia bacterium]|nr:hypothetical protein [Bacteroidia bacterium]
MKSLIAIGSFVLLSAFCAFQEGWVVSSITEVDTAHKNSETFYTGKKSYSIDITYSSFKGHEAVAPYETMQGYYRYDNGRSHSQMQGVHIIVNGNYKMILDTVHKTMIVTDPPSKLSAELMQINYENSKQYITSCKKSPGELITAFKMEFSEQVAYSAYSLSFAKDGQLKDITVFYRKEYPSDSKAPNSPKLKPKLKISYGPVVEKIMFNPAKEFELTKYFTELKGTLKATSAYSTYQVIDSRSSRKR